MKYLSLLLVIYTASFALSAKDINDKKVKKETVVTYKQQPWHTNEPYIDDYTKEWELVKKEPEKLAPEAVKKCDELFNVSARFLCKQKIGKKLSKDYIARGTQDYVDKHYDFLRKTTPKKLANFLASMDKLRAKTRLVRYPNKKELGEMTYQTINKEICLIESTIGRLKSKSFCHAKRY